MDIREILAGYDLDEYADGIIPLMRKSIRMELNPQDDEKIAVGASKMGGMPDLPQDMEWPCHADTNAPLSFIAQINFAETHPFDSDGRLPERGMLYFFYDCSIEDGMPWGFDPKDAAGKAVIYFDGDMEGLSRVDAPDELSEADYDGIFAGAALSFSESIDLPDPDSVQGDKLDLPEEAMETYWEALDDQAEEQPNKLLGHSDNIQGAMELECELTYNKLYCGDESGYKQAQKLGIGAGAADWELLMQVDSNDDLGMMWGDCGKLYLWIRAQDLAARNFGASWLILQCG